MSAQWYGTPDRHNDDGDGGSGSGGNVTVVAPIPLPVLVKNTLIKDPYDYIDCTMTAGLLTSAEFKIGGAGGTTVGTIVITYDGNDDIDTVEVV